MKRFAIKLPRPLAGSCLASISPLLVCVSVAFSLGLMSLVGILASRPASRFRRRTRPVVDRTPGSHTNARLIRVLFAGLFLAGQTIFGQPAQIILFRHAEKPDDPASVHLTEQGRQRARALVSLLGRSSPLTTNAPVAALYATRVTKHDHSHRTGETLAPLSRDLGLSVSTSFASDNFFLLATEVLNDPAYRGKTVIICWIHHDMAQLAAALGVRPPPPPWKDKTFDRLWLISYPKGKAELHDLPQHLLPNDSKR